MTDRLTAMLDEHIPYDPATRRRAKELILSILAKSETRDKYLRVLYRKLSTKPKRNKTL
jgi:hypothetical protein